MPLGYSETVLLQLLERFNHLFCLHTTCYELSILLANYLVGTAPNKGL